MSDLEAKSRYDPTEVEPRIVSRWLQSGLYHPEPKGTPAENFSIVIPPPNVTGVLHMGHALNNAIQDCLTRYRRMGGVRAKWIVGTDHAGIATQTQVERQLVQEGTSREALGREAFVERVWEWRRRYGGQIIEQLERLGASADFQEERFTLDERYVEAVLKVFVALYEKGYIYRDRYIVNWDPGSRSAISDLEVEDREVTDTLYYIDYPLASGSGAITVATVRPETMLADTAIAVHPDDERYQRLVGETAILPLVGRTLKIIADEYVKPEFGTGALKITPGHDPNDFEIGRRHGLEEIIVIGEDGRMAAPAPERFVGLPVLEARERGRRRAARGRADRAHRRSYDHAVPYSHRSGRADRAADLAAVVHARWTSSPVRRSTPSRRAACASTPSAGARSTSTGWRTSGPGASRASCGGATGSAGLVSTRRDPGDLRAGRAGAGRRRAGSATPTCSTPGSRARCGRSRRSGGPSRRRSCGAFYPTDALVHRARHHLPLGRADDHDGTRVHRRGPVRRRLRPLDHPGSRRAPDVEVAGHRDRPA